MGEKTRAALVGCGRIGYKFDLDEKRKGVWTHAKAYHKCEDIDFVGVFDVSGQNAAEAAKKYGVQAYPNLRSMLEDGVDLLSVAVPVHHHRSVLELVSRADKDLQPKILWMEKPFTGIYDLAKSYVDTYNRESRFRVHVNYQRRWCPAFRELVSYGPPKHIDVQFTRGMLNTGSHFVDFIAGLHEAWYGERLGSVAPAAQTTPRGFFMHFGEHHANFTMLDHLQYNLCHTTFYYDDRVVIAPPIMDHLLIVEAETSEQYSEYKDLAFHRPTYKSFEYDPMMEQARLLAAAIQADNYENLNSGLVTLSILADLTNYQTIQAMRVNR